ncbi:MAG: hypothetical protein ACJA2A_002075 [Cycloclasticus pugetii]|jgi:hypothetical protein
MNTLTRYLNLQNELTRLEDELKPDSDFLYCVHQTMNPLEFSAFYKGQDLEKISSALFRIKENDELTCIEQSIYNDQQIKQMHTHIMQWIKS